MFDIDPNKRPLLPFAEYFQAGMGTENAAPFLYALMRMVRPQRVLEIGLGYSTPWLLRALQDNEQVHIDWNADPGYFKRPYKPVLICIDDLSDEKSSAAKSIQELKDSNYLHLIEAHFQGQAAGINSKYGFLDFVWFDCGGPEEYRAFCEEYLPICSGYVFFHFTYLHGKPTTNLEIIKSFIEPDVSDPDAEAEWDYMDIVEPHKYRQGSVTMLRRRTAPNGAG